MATQHQLLEAGPDQQPVIANLLQLYTYEFSAELGTDVGADGRFAWDGLADYWSKDDLHPFLLMADGRLAGFALVQRILAADGTPVWDIEDFFVMAKYRRCGLGAFAAAEIFRRFSGAWQIRVLASNGRALSFWRQAISRAAKSPPAAPVAKQEDRPVYVFAFET